MIGLNDTAWNLWVNWRKAMKKPIKEFSVPFAQKKMAALGDRQMEAVEHSIAEGYQGLYLPNKTKAELDAEKRKVREQIEMRELEARAVKIGFRSPTSSDDLGGYRALVERAERAQPDKRRGMQSIASLLESNT
jgi:hypothetical protein